ncbi:MAG TPA: HD domain-containing protein [Spirochaetota bacterium]|nr:HD domain-containing protein [Spirochaetota bacterium]HOM39181.1 HD domain-containing protein [Spirochaetota bacterium]HPQ50035.1 HD domain-containing protein [Spirochaetota bacterium]
MIIRDYLSYKTGISSFLEYKGFNISYYHIFTEKPIEKIAKEYNAKFENFFYFIEDDKKTYILYSDNISNKNKMKELWLKNFSFNIEGFFNTNKYNFLDPFDIYNTLFKIQAIKKEVNINSLIEIMLVKTITGLEIDNSFIVDNNNPSIFIFRLVMEEMFRRGIVDKGIIIMDEYNILKYFIPEIEELKKVDHDKDYHPEGDGFDHLIETASYIKTTDYAFAWATLLHDIGKPFSFKEENRKFSNHGIIGANIVKNILTRMNYNDDIIKEAVFLVENHMIPAIIDKINYDKKEKIIKSPYFNKLLKLYKIDILSSNKDLSKYAKIKNYVTNF